MMKTVTQVIALVLCIISMAKADVTNNLRGYSVDISNGHVNINTDNGNVTINLNNTTDKFIGGTYQGPNADPPIQSGSPYSYDPAQIGN